MSKMKEKQRRETFYTPRQVALWCGVSPRTVVRWIREGKIEGTKFGRVWRVSATAWMEFLRGL